MSDNGPPPPRNVEVEYALIATLLFDPRRVDGVADMLAPTDFADPFLGRLFDLIVSHHAKGNSLSALTLRPLIAHDPSFDEMGGNAFLAQITTAATVLVDAWAVARQIVDLSRRRTLIAALNEAATACADVSDDLAGAVSLVDRGLAVATATASEAIEISASKAMERLLENAGKERRAVTSARIGCLDRLIGGMRPAQVIIGAGRPGMGKTAAALSFAVGAAESGYGVMFVSLEMGADELMARVAADMAYDGPGQAAYADINGDNPSRIAREAMASAAHKLDGLPFQIIDAGTLSVGRLDMLVRRTKRLMAARGQSLDLVVVDYLQLLRADEKGRSNYEAVSEVSRRLKAMAKDHNVAMFALAQLSREVEKREDKRPHLSDLRDSGQIEQDADAVVFFYRHEYYLRQALPDEDHRDYAEMYQELERVAGGIDFICAKRRNGVIGTARGTFSGQYQAVRG